MLRYVLPLMFITQISSAQSLNTTVGTQKIAGIPTISTATLKHTSDTFELKNIGSALRSKKVAFMNFDVYVGQLLGTENDGFKKSQPLQSAIEQKAIAMQMTFLRDVDIEKIMTSFEDSFKANHIDTKTPEIAQVLEAVKNNGDLKKGSTLTFIGIKKNDSDTIIFEGSQSKGIEVSGKQLILKIFSLWLGNTADSGIAEFQKNLLK